MLPSNKLTRRYAHETGKRMKSNWARISSVEWHQFHQELPKPCPKDVYLREARKFLHSKGVHI